MNKHTLITVEVSITLLNFFETALLERMVEGGTSTKIFSRSSTVPKTL